MADGVIRKLAVEQRRRLIASVLNAVDHETDPRLRRDRIIASINIYHDFILDVVKVSDEECMRNEHAVDLIAAVHTSQQRIERASRVNHG